MSKKFVPHEVKEFSGFYGKQGAVAKWTGTTEMQRRELMAKPIFFRMHNKNPEKARQRLISVVGERRALELIMQWKGEGCAVPVPTP